VQKSDEKSDSILKLETASGQVEFEHQEYFNRVYTQIDEV